MTNSGATILIKCFISTAIHITTVESGVSKHLDSKQSAVSEQSTVIELFSKNLTGGSALTRFSSSMNFIKHGQIGTIFVLHGFSSNTNLFLQSQKTMLDENPLLHL